MRKPLYVAVGSCLFLGLAMGIGFQSAWLGLWVAIVSILAVIVYGSANIRSGFFLETVNRLPEKQNALVLSFDDGPDAATSGIVSVLEKHQVKACFFLIGKNVPGRENLVRSLALGGHVVGNHTYSHDNWMDFWSATRFYHDIEKASALLREITGAPVRFFRPPFGVTNPSVAKAVNRLELSFLRYGEKYG
jgi:peptidoglycan-N-acetylglucosamine deacetylase